MNKSLTRKNSNQDLWSPWSVFKDDLWDVFDRFAQDMGPAFSNQVDTFSPKIEFKDKGQSYELCAEIPGMDEKDINISLRDNSLILEGEKKNEMKQEDKKAGTYHSEFSYGRFYRTIPLSDDVDTENVTANYRNGVLQVELKKRPETQSKVKKIQIGSGNQGSLASPSKEKH